MTRDVTDLIAGDHTVPLIPAATAAAYGGKPLDLHVIGREHNLTFRADGQCAPEGRASDCVGNPV